MTIPAVTCDSDIEYVWNSGVHSAALSASATGSPTSWEWRVLSVPVGLELLLIGAHGDFTDGVATLQNPTLPVPTHLASGTIVLQCRAQNVDGWSLPATDRESGQQCIGIQDINGFVFLGDFQYSWGEQKLNPLLRAISSYALHKATVGEIHALTNKPTPVGADELLIEDSADSWNKKRLAISNLPIDPDEKVKISGTDTTTAYLDSKVVVANGLTKTTLLPAGNEQLQLSPTYGSAANTVCQGNDARLSDARTPVAHSTNHKHSGGDEVATDTAGANAIPKAGSGGKLDIGWLPTGATGSTVCIGNDSRLSDTRTDSNAVHKNVASEIHGITNKGSPVSADELLIEDSADSWNKKRIAISSLPSGGLDTTAIHKATAAEISAMTEKNPPISADLIVIEDSADSYNKKKVQIGNLPSGGGGFSGREQEFTAAGGDEDFTLAAGPAANANMLSGYNILGVFRNGQRLRYQAVPASNLEYGYTNATTKINCKSLVLGDIITVVYSTT